MTEESNASSDEKNTTSEAKSTVGTAGNKGSDESQTASSTNSAQSSGSEQPSDSSEARSEVASTAPVGDGASAVTPTPVPHAPAETEISYTFQAGDSLFGLFLQFRVSVSNIRRWNSLVANPRVGQVLKLKVMQ